MSLTIRMAQGGSGNLLPNWTRTRMERRRRGVAAFRGAVDNPMTVADSIHPTFTEAMGEAARRRRVPELKDFLTRIEPAANHCFRVWSYPAPNPYEASKGRIPSHLHQRERDDECSQQAPVKGVSAYSSAGPTIGAVTLLPDNLLRAQDAFISHCLVVKARTSRPRTFLWEIVRDDGYSRCQVRRSLGSYRSMEEAYTQGSVALAQVGAQGAMVELGSAPTSGMAGPKNPDQFAKAASGTDFFSAAASRSSSVDHRHPRSQQTGQVHRPDRVRTDATHNLDGIMAAGKSSRR